MELATAPTLAPDLVRKYKVPLERSFAFDRFKVRFGKCDYRHQLRNWLALRQ
jgi:hypothetical protein